MSYAYEIRVRVVERRLRELFEVIRGDEIRANGNGQGLLGGHVPERRHPDEDSYVARDSR